jgi:hypothetical protein
MHLRVSEGQQLEHTTFISSHRHLTAHLL